MLLFTKKDCSECNVVYEWLLTIAKELKDEPIAFGKIDVEENDIDRYAGLVFSSTVWFTGAFEVPPRCSLYPIIGGTLNSNGGTLSYDKIGGLYSQFTTSIREMFLYIPTLPNPYNQ